MPTFSRRFFACLVATCLLAPLARAQENPILGVWSAQARSANGFQIGIYVWRFASDGGFQHRMVLNPTQPGTPGSTVDYVGRYSFSREQNLLQLLYVDYEPKQVCNAGFCGPVPSGVPLNQPIATSVKFLDANRMVTQDASGPMTWVRRP